MTSKSILPGGGSPNAMQRHIRARAGAWRGKISGVQLLKLTRPQAKRN